MAAPVGWAGSMGRRADKGAGHVAAPAPMIFDEPHGDPGQR